jgi:tRNA-dihydrouridine synthase B
MEYINPINIGRHRLSNNIILAPMAAVNCPAFRMHCTQKGAGHTYTQMIDPDEYNKNPEQGYYRFIDRLSQEKSLTVQVLGSRPEPLSECIQHIEEHADIIDLNLGCAEPEMLKKQYGSFLLKHPEQIKRTINAILNNTNKPVTAKIRSGWESVNALEVGKILEDFGVDALAIHPRTRKQKYTGKADWTIIKDLKEKLNIPIIGNGDIITPTHAKAMFDQTKCDAIMLGRAAIGSPLIFTEVNQFLKTGIIKEITQKEKYTSLKEFSELYKKQHRQRFEELKQHTLWFLKGSPKHLKMKFTKINSLEEFNKRIQDL